MNEFPKGLRSWIEVFEKFLVIATLCVGIFKGFGYLSAKTEQAESTAAREKAIMQETKKRTETLDLFARTYAREFEQINKEIRDVDVNLAKAIRKDSADWEKYHALRLQKTEDKQKLLEEMGKQIIELQKYSLKRQSTLKQPSE